MLWFYIQVFCSSVLCCHDFEAQVPPLSHVCAINLYAAKTRPRARILLFSFCAFVLFYCRTFRHVSYLNAILFTLCLFKGEVLRQYNNGSNTVVQSLRLPLNTLNTINLLTLNHCISKHTNVPFNVYLPVLLQESLDPKMNINLSKQCRKGIESCSSGENLTLEVIP